MIPASGLQKLQHCHMERKMGTWHEHIMAAEEHMYLLEFNFNLLCALDSNWLRCKAKRVRKVLSKSQDYFVLAWSWPRIWHNLLYTLYIFIYCISFKSLFEDQMPVCGSESPRFKECRSKRGLCFDRFKLLLKKVAKTTLWQAKVKQWNTQRFKVNWKLWTWASLQYPQFTINIRTQAVFDQYQEVICSIQYFHVFPRLVFKSQCFT